MNKIKKLTAYIFYIIGNIISKIPFDFTYSLYNTLMTRSMLIQDWAENETPWIKVLPNDK